MNETVQTAPSQGLHALGMAGFFDGSPIPTFVIDIDHVVTHFNRACEVTFSLAAKDVLGTRKLGQLLYQVDRPLMADMIVDGISPEKMAERYRNACFAPCKHVPEAYSAEKFFPNLGATGGWLLFTAAPLRDAQGTLVGAIETLQDITGRKQGEAALLKAESMARAAELSELNSKLSKAEDYLVQSEKLASIGQLAAGVAHEINNPIGYIFSNYGSLETYWGDLFSMLQAYEAEEVHITDPQARERLSKRKADIDLGFLKEDIPVLMRESKEGIDRVRKIVQDLKDFSHVDAGQEWVWVDIIKGIDSTLNVVNNEVKYKADVVRDYGDIPQIECLPSQINQVVMNLVVNASHAMGDERGTITIRTGTEGESVWFEVADSGSGIPKDMLVRIFDPFFTTKPVGKGTGLGLSLSYGIVKKHNGRMDVTSEVGCGTCFRVTLPIKHEESTAQSATQP